MKATQFKLELKRIKETLRGKEVRVSLNGESRSFKTLKSLGNRILELELRGCTFSFDCEDNRSIVADNGIDIASAISRFGTNA